MIFVQVKASFARAKDDYFGKEIWLVITLALRQHAAGRDVKVDINNHFSEYSS